MTFNPATFRMADEASMATVTPIAADPFAPKQPGETNAQYMARVTAAYKAQPQPQLTPQQQAAGATVQFVRTGAGGVGEYKIVYPIGVGFDPVTGQPTGTNAFKNIGTAGAAGGMTGGVTAGTTGATATPVDMTAQNARQSAYDLLYQQFSQYGLGSLVEDIKGLIQSNKSPSEFSILLQQTPAYQQRFSANKDRIAAGLRALSPAEYIGLEDQYQNIMRNYGLPASYYTKDATGKQPGFDKFLAGDVSAAELEDRIATAQQRVINANPEVSNALKQFYPDITNGDILAYTLDPKNALANIKRKVTAAEIGGAAMAQGLATGATRAEELAGYGVTKAQAQQGFGTIAEFLPTAEKLGDIYAKQGLGGYTQTTAEQEVFGTAGAAQAAQKRRKLTELERASFAGSAGAAQGALARERAGQF